MDAALLFAMFLVGLGAGGGIAWLFFRNALSMAREQERVACLTDIKVAEAQAAAKEEAIAELRTTLGQKHAELQQRGEEIVQLKQQHAVLQTTLKKEHEKIEEKIKLLSEAEKHFKDTFAALAAKALKDNNAEFDKLSKPVRDTLSDINTKIAIANNFAKELSAETSKLAKALQKPEVRGQWGEMHLRRVVELLGMVERCDFHEQQVIGEEEALQRPDLTVHLPGDRNLAVDAKAPMQAFLDAAQAADEPERQAKLAEFVRHVRDHVKRLGSKNYYQNLDNSPEFVVLYLPTEAVYSAALTCDAGLLEFATEYRVRLAGPTNLMSLLQTVAFEWKQHAMAKNAREICALAEELYNRISVFGGHIGKLGDQLNKSVRAYNDAIGSLESRVMPQARRFEQLGAAPTDGRIAELTPVDLSARAVQCAEFMIEQVENELNDEERMTRKTELISHWDEP